MIVERAPSSSGTWTSADHGLHRFSGKKEMLSIGSSRFDHDMISTSFPKFSSVPSPITPSLEAPINLVAAGWIFTTETLGPARWQVSGSKGTALFAASSGRIGDAFREVERQALLREAEKNFEA